jgi:hypothetical protein
MFIPRITQNTQLHAHSVHKLNGFLNATSGGTHSNNSNLNIKSTNKKNTLDSTNA